MASLAAPLHICVVGAGVVGLSSALVALRRGLSVTIVADRFTPGRVCG